jgi:hypothetical protein
MIPHLGKQPLDTSWGTRPAQHNSKESPKIRGNWALKENMVSCLHLTTNLALNWTRPFPFFQLNPALDSVVKSHPKNDLHFEGYSAFLDCHQILVPDTTNVINL